MSMLVYSRWQDSMMRAALKSRRVLILAGPRQCGKTSLAKLLVSSKAIYRTLDDLALLESALSDPQGFVRHGDELMIIDEVQRAPKLLQAVKQEVDTRQSPGRFLLTGSANIQCLPGVTESLAGRVRKIRLRTLARGEIEGTRPQFLAEAFKGKFSRFQSTQDKEAYIQDALSGGYPEAIRMSSDRERRRWHQDYISSLMERDLKDIVNIKRQESMMRLLEILAAWSSKFIDISSIGSSLGLSRPTIEAYINALEALYLVERLHPWAKTDYDRVSKKDKLFMTDTGLMSSILGWTLEKVRLDGDLNGKLLETFVFTQLMALLEAQEEYYRLYHYRDREKREIDFLVENEAGDLLGIEVKSGSTVGRDTFASLRWFKEHMAKGHRFKGIVLYTGEHILPFGEDLWAVPIQALWA